MEQWKSGFFGLDAKVSGLRGHEEAIFKQKRSKNYNDLKEMGLTFNRKICNVTSPVFTSEESIACPLNQIRPEWYDTSSKYNRQEGIIS